MKQRTRMTFTAGGIFLSLLAALAFAPPANAQDDQGEVEKVLVLQPSRDGLTSGPFGHTGQAGAVHIEVEQGQTTLQFSLTGLTPNAVHSVWLILDSGANPCGTDGLPACLAPFVTCNLPACQVLDPATGRLINVFRLSPAAADDAGFKAGMGLDPNGFVTDGDGNANFTIKLNYDIFLPNVAPVVLRSGSPLASMSTQSLAVAFDAAGTTCFSSPGANFEGRVDSAYLRVYQDKPGTIANLPAFSPGYQLLDANGKPQLVRAGVRAFYLIEHFDRLTHGHLLGRHVVNPLSSSCGDFDSRLSGKLADAVPED